MDSKGKFTKQCGTDFLHHNWGINPGESIKVRRTTPKDKLTILDRQCKNRHYSTVSCCNGCIAYVEKICTECIRESVTVRDIDVRASYDKKSVGFQKEY